MAMSEPNHDVLNSPDPAGYGNAVTPSDSTNFTRVARGLYVGNGGNIAVVEPDGSTTLYQNVPTGTILPVRCRRVNATNTTASAIVALY